MRQGTLKPVRALLGIYAAVLLIVGMVYAQDSGRGQSSYAPVDIWERAEVRGSTTAQVKNHARVVADGRSDAQA